MKQENGIFQVEANNKYGDAIPATIKEIHPRARFSLSWINNSNSDEEFKYEEPIVILELETTIGKFFAEIPISIESIVNGSLSSLLNLIEGYNFSNITRKDVYLYPEETRKNSFKAAIRGETGLSIDSYEVTIYNWEEIEPTYSEEPRGQRNPNEERSIVWMNNIVALKKEQYFSSNGKWLEREISSVEILEESIKVNVKVLPEWTASWEFTGPLNGRNSFLEFTENSGLPPYKKGIKGSLIYIHPVDNLDAGLPRYEFMRNTTERLVLSAKPKQPNNESNLITRFKNMITGKRKVEVSSISKKRPRRAKSSVKYEDVDDELKEGCGKTSLQKSTESKTVS